MRRTTIFIPEKLDAELRDYARRKQHPVAWVVREAVSTYLATHPLPFRMPASIGIVDSGRSDISEREDLIFADLTPQDDRVPRVRARTTRARPRKRSSRR